MARSEAAKTIACLYNVLSELVSSHRNQRMLVKMMSVVMSEQTAERENNSRNRNI